VHQYGRRWDALAALSVPLILTGVWFAVAMVATVRARPGGRTALASFLVTEVAFYAVHNASGAFAADMPLSNPVLLIASALGYASTVVSVVYLVLTARTRHAARASSGAAGGSKGGVTTRAWSASTFAALDLYGARGASRRRRLVMAEFIAGTLAMLALGGFLLSRGAWWWGGWLVGCGLNYAALTVLAVRLRSPDRLNAAVAGLDVASELRRYGLAQVLLFVPAVVALAALGQSATVRRRRP
jgi:hypothetical protein